MGICESTNNNDNNQVSFRCFYDVKNINEEIRIINDRFYIYIYIYK